MLKVRLQSHSAPVVSPKKVIRVSLYNCFRDIYVREGVAGLWRGVAPTATRAALVAGVQLPVYDMTKLFMLRNNILPGKTIKYFRKNKLILYIPETIYQSKDRIVIKNLVLKLPPFFTLCVGEGKKAVISKHKRRSGSHNLPQMRRLKRFI